MSMQDDLNKEMDRIADKVLNTTQRDTDYTIDEIDSVRNKVRDLLDEYAKEDGTISKNRLRKLLRELDEIENDIFTEFEENINISIEDIVDETESNMTEAIAASLGVVVFYGAMTNKPSRKSIMDDVKEYIFNTETGGIKLRDRLESTSGLLRDEIQKSIRYGATRNESIIDISKRIKKSFDDTAWQFRRIMTTELPLALRKTLLSIGGKSKVIKGVKIIDNRGRHKYHETHMCYKYAERDIYGMGKGVYKVTDTYILNPHPQCSAYYHYILNDNELGGDN